MNGLLMKVLAWRLSRYGYKTKTLSYRFLVQSPAENAAVVAKTLKDIDTPVVHWAAHSLGGVVWMHLLHSETSLPPGRTVLLGSPVLGSSAATRLHKKPLLRPLLGRSIESGLLGGAPVDVKDRSVGLIRGGGWFSLSRLVIGSEEPSDGVVLHSETEVSGVADTTEVPYSHSMMIFSAKTARKAAEFFANGRFGTDKVN